jgi:hypothetical protein
LHLGTNSWLAYDEPFGPELTAEGLSRVEATPTSHFQQWERHHAAICFSILRQITTPLSDRRQLFLGHF